MSASSVQFSQGPHLALQGPRFGLEKACPCEDDRIRHLWPILSLVAELCLRSGLQLGRNLYAGWQMAIAPLKRLGFARLVEIARMLKNIINAGKPRCPTRSSPWPRRCPRKLEVPMCTPFRAEKPGTCGTLWSRSLSEGWQWDCVVQPAWSEIPAEGLIRWT